MTGQVHTGDALEVLRTMPENSVDSIVTDPPAGIGFMGKAWDHNKGGRDKWIAWMTGIAVECLRVLKPGGHALVWSLPRTSHWTATAWENAGFEVRDRIGHIFGSGFPKSENISIAVDKKACRGELIEKLGRRPTKEEWKEAWKIYREVVGRAKGAGSSKTESLGVFNPEYNATSPATPAAKQWDGWGTGLKPAVEDWWLLRKPLSEPTVAANVLKWGTGGINIEQSRVAGIPRTTHKDGSRRLPSTVNAPIKGFKEFRQVVPSGRFPSHLIHDGSDDVMAVFPVTTSGNHKLHKQGSREGFNTCKIDTFENVGDSGSAARFFYCAKPSRVERNMGCEELPDRDPHTTYAGDKWSREYFRNTLTNKRTPIKNNHPTVKSLALMEYLIKLITPPGGIVLDPFAGSGSTLIAAVQSGFRCIGIEKEAEYVTIIRQRLAPVLEQRKQRLAQKELFDEPVPCRS